MTKQIQAYGLAKALEFLASWLSLRARQIDLPGFAVAISYKNKVIFDQPYGLADLERGEPLTPKHFFSIGSQSKMLTASAIMQLAEQRKIKLDEKIVAYLPWLAAHSDRRMRKVTIKQLLSHTSGMTRDGLVAKHWQLLVPFPSAAELRQTILTTDLLLPPGNRLKYSNIGYGLLGQLLQEVTGVDYNTYVRKHIIEPLQLATTLAPPSRVATGYASPLDHKRLASPMPIATNALSPAVGWYATAADMCRFVDAQMTGDRRLLRETSKRLLQTNHSPVTSPKGHNVAYGLGFGMYQLDGRRIVGHSGSFIGHRSCTYFDPKIQLAVAVLANGQDAMVMQMLRGVFHCIDFFQAAATGPVSLRRKKFNVRLMNPQSIVEIVVTKRRMVAVRPIDWLPFADPEELEYVDATKLRIKRAHPLLGMGEYAIFSMKHGRITEVNFLGASMQVVGK